MHTSTTLISLVVLSGLSVGAPQHQHALDESDTHLTVRGCWGDEHGLIEGNVFSVPVTHDFDSPIKKLKEFNRARGIHDNRLDLVIVGDGYTQSEMGQFHIDASNISDSFFNFEPFKSYKPYFRVTPVEVISIESGVDNDPAPGIDRFTALDMSYWCNGTERLLCVNTFKANNAAAAGAPDVDQVIAIANSRKYGGAGYSDANIGTAAGQNSSSANIAIHELGHSLGDLADEYFTGSTSTYTGSERREKNVSIFEEDEQIEMQTKWMRWMGASIEGFDGPIGTYEGARYNRFGLFRPSPDSMMKRLGSEFNLVSAQELIRSIYAEVHPIDDGTPNNTVVERVGSLWVQPMQPLNHDLEVKWYLDEVEITELAGLHSIDLGVINIDSEEHIVRVEVADRTPWVRNEAMRNLIMVKSRIYHIEACTQLADLTGEGNVDFFDVSAFLNGFNQQTEIADLNDDQMHDFFDVSLFLNAFQSGACN